MYSKSNFRGPRKNENDEGARTGSSQYSSLEELTHPAEAQEQRARALERRSVKVSSLSLVFSE
jgi:hypothetical protein